MNTKMDELLDTACYLIDIFPQTVPSKDDGRYFEVEKYFQKDRRTLNEKFCRLLLKLYCYYDFRLWSGFAFDRELPPARMICEIQEYLSEKRESCIYLPESDAMICIDSDSLYLSVYHPDEHLKERITQLAYSEGLFFYPAP